MQLHFATMILGALSFLIPAGLADQGQAREAQPAVCECRSGAGAGQLRERPAEGKEKLSIEVRDDKGARRASDPRRRPSISSAAGGSARSGSCSIVAFSVLSLQATRNSHQFAAVVGTVTAWNFGEWAAAVRRRRLASDGASPISSAGVPRLVAFGAVTLVLALGRARASFTR